MELVNDPAVTPWLQVNLQTNLAFTVYAYLGWAFWFSVPWYMYLTFHAEPLWM